MWWDRHNQREFGAAGHTVPAIRKQRERKAGGDDLAFPVFFSWDPGHRMLLPTFRVGLQ